MGIFIILFIVVIRDLKNPEKSILGNRNIFQEIVTVCLPQKYCVSWAKEPKVLLLYTIEICEFL